MAGVSGLNEWPAYRRSARKWPGLANCWLAATVALILWALAPKSAFATNGIEPIGLSTQSLIRGGADVAVGDSALDQINNPSTLTLLGRSLDLSGELFMPQMRWSNSVDSDKSRFRHLPLGHAGVSIPVNSQISLGAAFWSKSLLSTDYKMRIPTDRLNRRRVGADLRNFGFGLNAGVEVTEKLSLGAGVRAELATAEFSTTVGPADVSFNRGWALGAGFQLGALYQLTPRIMLGLGYRSPSWFPQMLGKNGKSAMTNDWIFSIPGVATLPLGHALINDIVLPQRLAAGATWQATDRLRLTTEGRWINYSDSTLNRADFEIEIPRRLNLRMPIGYRDQWAAMIGAEYKLTDQWTIGSGYHFASNPIDRKYLLPIADMIVQHHLSLGATFRTKKWWLGGGYLLGLPSSMSSVSQIELPQHVIRNRQEIRQLQHSMFVGLGMNW